MGDMKGIDIHDIFGFGEPLTKFVDTIRCGIGKAYEPTHIKRMAKAKAQEIEIIGKKVTDNMTLPTKYDDGKVLIDSTSADELVKRTGERLFYQEIRRQQNIDTVIDESYEQIKNEDTVSAEPVNEDWLFKFFDFVGDISDEQMQKIWSKILFGEIKQPNTYSIRTLNTLRNMTKYEAETFQKISKFKISLDKDKVVITSDHKILEKYDVRYEELLKMEDCGLINCRDFIAIKLDEKEDFYTDKIFIHTEGKASMGVYTFTESGKQLLNVLEDNTNYEYTLEVLRKLKLKNPTVLIEAFKISSINKQRQDGNIKTIEIIYDEERDLLEE